MFAARHCNIDSLNVAPTDDPSMSQLTLVMQGDHAMLEQIVRQTRKLIDVIDVIILAPPSQATSHGSPNGRLSLAGTA